MPLTPALARFATAAPFVLLAASTVLTAALAWQAFAAAASHRELAQRVLHDYAELAATEFSRRTTAYVGNYGVVVALRSLAQTASDERTLPPREVLQTAMPVESRRAIEFVGPLFRFAADGSAFVSEDADLAPGLRDVLRYAAAQPRAGGTLCVRWPQEGGTRVFVLAPVLAAESRAWAGFEVSSAALTTWLREFSAAEPLLPRTLAAVAVIVTVRAPD